LKARVDVGGASVDVDLAHPFDLAHPVAFAPPGRAGAQPFGAPAPHAEPLRVGHFSGDVLQGGSCNCSTITLTPHASGTHTECAGHLTREPLSAWKIVPHGLLPAVLVRVMPEREPDSASSRDRVVSGAALDAAWPAALPFEPLALILDTGFGATYGAPADVAYLTPGAAQRVVTRGIEHLLVDLPSIDRMDDGGVLAAHRVFFGLEPGASRLADARRARCTVTELAAIPQAAPPGAYLLALQVPAIAGDAVPSRPLLYPLASPARRGT
jgi:kynurenine formamidase